MFAAALTFNAPAAANGRFPRAQRLVEDASEPSRLALYGTYGLLTTSDAGQTWQYVCEGATGLFSGEAPLLELLPEGRVILSSETGLRASHFPVCNWADALAPSSPNAVQDITRDPAGPSVLWALISEPELNVGFRSGVQRSTDGGKTWTPSARVPTELLGLGLTIDVAPSDAQRVYLSGLDDQGRGVLVRSDDAGETWHGSLIPGTTSLAQPYIAAVSPTDPDLLFVRSDVLETYQGELQPNDALWMSADGGASFTRIFSRRAKLLGFALSPDGQTLLLGYGDPILFSFEVEPEQTGLYRARVADLLAAPAQGSEALQKIFAGNVTCLRWTGQGLFACLSQAEQGFELGRAADADASFEQARPFEPVLDLRQVLPLSCAADSSARSCVSDADYGWPFVCTKLGADCSYGLAQAGAAGEAATAEGGEAGQASGAGGGVGGLLPEGGAGVGGDAVTSAGKPPVSKPGSSCGCRVGGEQLTALQFASCWLVLAQLAWRRRSRRPSQLDTEAR